MDTPCRPDDVAFLYSGQGSQTYQMGRDLFVQRRAFYRHLMDIDDLVRQFSGQSVVDVIYDPRHKISDAFDRTSLTHPAIFMIEYAVSRALMEQGLQPSYLIASSMGVFAALALAGCISVEHAALAVVTQGRLVEQRCAAGAMLALPGASEDRMVMLAREFDCEVASIGGRSAGVLSMARSQLGEIEAALKCDGVLFRRLAVSNAFHSRWIDAAREPFLSFSASLCFKAPRIPLACCFGNGGPIDVTAACLWDAIREPIRFDAAITGLCARQRWWFVDVGPSGSLAAAMTRHARASADEGYEADAVFSPFGGCAARYDRLLAAASRRM
jgi:bacillaene synthase trans-acting acyltransferase